MRVKNKTRGTRGGGIRVPVMGRAEANGRQAKTADVARKPNVMRPQVKKGNKKRQ